MRERLVMRDCGRKYNVEYFSQNEKKVKVDLT